MLYQIYIAYLTITAIHGAYVSYSYLRWMLGGAYSSAQWMYSLVYDIPEPLLQIEDKSASGGGGILSGDSIGPGGGGGDISSEDSIGPGGGGGISSGDSIGSGGGGGGGS